MTFPAVTICNNNAVMMNKLRANDDLNQMVYGTSDTSNSDNNTGNSVSIDGIYTICGCVYTLYIVVPWFICISCFV